MLFIVKLLPTRFYNKIISNRFIMFSFNELLLQNHFPSLFRLKIHVQSIFTVKYFPMHFHKKNFPMHFYDKIIFNNTLL